MSSPDETKLADAVLHQGDYPAYRTRAAAAGLAELRRLRGEARAPWIPLAAAATLALCAAGLWLNRPPSTNPAAAPTTAPTPITTATATTSTTATPTPPPAPFILRTTPQTAATRFATQPHPAARIPHLAAATFPTQPGQAPRLTDDQLLALFPNQPAGFATLQNGRRTFLLPHAAKN